MVLSINFLSFFCNLSSWVNWNFTTMQHTHIRHTQPPLNGRTLVNKGLSSLPTHCKNVFWGCSLEGSLKGGGGIFSVGYFSTVAYSSFKEQVSPTKRLHRFRPYRWQHRVIYTWQTKENNKQINNQMKMWRKKKTSLRVLTIKPKHMVFNLALKWEFVIWKLKI